MPLKGEVFDCFHHGLLVLSADGTILLGNQEALRILEAVGGRLDGATCCRTLRCPESGDACLTELAVNNVLGVHEVRRDLSTPSGTQAVWISAVSIATDPVRILLQIRRGDRYDRRLRADPDWRSTQKLRITTLGQTSISSGSMTIDGGWLDKRAGQLLRYLVVRRGRATTTDEIGESLWRNANYSIASNVRVCVHRLRAELEPHRSNGQTPDFLLTNGGSYRLDVDRVDIDADAFELHVVEGLRRAGTGAEGATRELELGLALYRGEFFADAPFAEWACGERRRLHELACTGLQTLSRLHRSSGHTDSAARWLEQLAGLQPLDEAVCRELVELDISEGRGSDAKRRYERLCRMMTEALGYQPSFTLADIVRSS